MNVIDLEKARLHPYGEVGVLLRFDESWPEANLKILHLVPFLVENNVRFVAGISTLLFIFETHASFQERCGEIKSLLEKARVFKNSTRSLQLPVLLEGPDLNEILNEKKMTLEAFQHLFFSQEYRVLTVGFSPGFPYLGPLHPDLTLPRKSTPRTEVPEGSLALARCFVGIYPQKTAGGWNLIGRTPMRIFSPESPTPFLLHYGDQVSFFPVSSSNSDQQTSVGSAPDFVPKSPVFELLSGGICTTFQDRGRFQFQHMGVPPSGPLDEESFLCGNSLLRNHPEAVSLEFSFPAPRLKALKKVSLALSGADFSPHIAGNPVPTDGIFEMDSGDVLQFHARRKGMWGYLAIQGGFEAPRFLNSASTMARGSFGAVRRLRTGDLLGCAQQSTYQASPREIPILPEKGKIPFFSLPEIPPECLSEFAGQTFTLSHELDRSGYRLKGPKVSLPDGEVLPEPNLVGSIQVPPSGEPIVILHDGPTSGGYPKIGIIPKKHLRTLTQLTPGSAVEFKAVSP